MKKISRETITTIGIGSALLIANSWHVITEAAKNKPGELFTGIAHYFADYFLYISHILQGANGAWFFTNHMYTNEPMPPTWIYWLYTILGKISILGIDPFAVYNGSLFLFAAALLYLWWRLIPVILPKYPPGTHLLTFIFITTASNFPGLGEFWFSPTPALNRLGGVPHQIFQTLLLLTVLLIFSSLVTHTKRPTLLLLTRYLILALVSFTAATATPIQMLLICGAVTIFLGLTIRKEKISQYVWLGITLALPAFAGALLTNTEFARQPIATSAKLWEDSQPVSVSPWQFILAIGPISLFIPFGMRLFFRKITPLGAMLGIFGTFSVIVFFSPIPKILGTTPVRWLSPASLGIFPIVAAIGFAEIIRLTQKIIPHTYSKISISTLLLVIYLSFTLPAVHSQIYARTQPLRSDIAMRQLNHIASPAMDALIFLYNAPGHDNNLVITDPKLPYDTLIPIIAGLRSFTGHPIHTLYPQTKQDLRSQFFAGRMDESRALQFINDHAISHILLSTDTVKILPRYSFLSPVFQNDIAVIYAIGN